MYNYTSITYTRVWHLETVRLQLNCLFSVTQRFLVLFEATERIGAVEEELGALRVPLNRFRKELHSSSMVTRLQKLHALQLQLLRLKHTNPVYYDYRGSI